MKSAISVAPKPTETKPLTLAKALQLRKELLERQNSDPQYQALRLRGLAGLIRASEQGLDEVTNVHEVCFFLASVVDDVAECLSPDVDGSRS